MANKIKIGLGLILVIVGALYIRSCKTDKTPTVAFNAPLSPNAAAQVVVQNRHIAVRTDKETKASYVPDGGYATALIQKDGKLNLSVKSAGLTFKPVAGMICGEHVRGALGAEFAYWNRLELYVGVGFPWPVGFAGAGYRLDQVKMLSNTSLFAGIDTQKYINIGFLVRF